MPQARDEAGNIWETDAQGNPVRLITPAQGAGQVFTLPENPREAQRDAQTQADREADNARADAALAIQQQNAAAMNELRTLQAQAEREKQNGGRARATTLAALVRQINRVQALYDANIAPEPYGPISSAADMISRLPENQQFNTAGAQLSSLGLSAFRVPGSGTVSDRDAIMFDRANMPTSDVADIAIEEQLAGMRARVEEEYRAMGQEPPQWGATQQDNRDPVALRSALEAPDAGSTPAAPPPGVAASGETRTIRDDRLAAQVDAMINAGADEATINSVLTQQGWQPLPLGALAGARAWMRNNPGKRYFGANPEREVPLTVGQRIAGSPAGAFAANWADTATAGTASALAGDQGRGAIDAMNALHPDASLFGSMGGGVMGAAGAEAAVAARAPLALARFAPRIADALYGGLSGFNAADEGQGLTGAVTGAALGAGGGAVGDRAMRGVGAVARGVTDPAVQRLRALGIPLTVGRAVGQSGWLGNAVKRGEEALSSLPLVGSQISNRFDEGLQGLNRAAFDVGSETLGGQVNSTGAEGLRQLRQLVGDQYDNALSPVRIDVAGDPAALQDISDALGRAQAVPQVGQNIADALQYRIAGGAPDGTMSGRDFQEAYRGLARDGRAAASGPYANEFAGVMREGQDALAGALERQNPGAYEGFLAANAGNRRASILADAVNQAKNQNDELFTPAQLNTADANNATRLTGRVNSASGNRPFAELARDAQQVMGNRLPNSGTADRTLATLALGGGVGAGAGLAAGDTGTGTGLGLGTTLMLLAGGSRVGQKALTEALLARPALLSAFGRRTDLQGRLGSAIGAGVSPLLVSQP